MSKTRVTMAPGHCGRHARQQDALNFLLATALIFPRVRVAGQADRNPGFNSDSGARPGAFSLSFGEGTPRVAVSPLAKVATHAGAAQAQDGTVRITF